MDCVSRTKQENLFLSTPQFIFQDQAERNAHYRDHQRAPKDRPETSEGEGDAKSLTNLSGQPK